MAKAATAAAASAAKPKVVTLSTKQLANEIADKQGLTHKQGAAILDDLSAAITKHLKKGSKIRLNGLGIMQVRKRAARMGRNPATGETIQIPAKKKIAFRASKELKEAVGK